MMVKPTGKYPLVSICIPTYNGEKYILEALESAVNQTYPNLEIVISDDTSCDKTIQIITEFQKGRDISINIFHHTPSGIGANWNNCMKHANGEYIKFLFQDDVLFPTCVEELLTLFSLHKDLGLAACKREIIVEEKATTATETWKTKYGDLQEGIELKKNGYYILDSGILKNEKFIKNNKIGEPSTVLFPRVIVEKVGFFREDLIQVLDLEFYCRILKHRKIIILNKELAAFRIHPAQATNVNKNNISKDYEKYYRLLYKYYFWHLGYKTQKNLVKRFHPLGKLYSYIRN